MTRKDVNGIALVSSTRSRLRLLLMSFVVLGAAMGVRALWPSNQAEAQIFKPRAKQSRTVADTSQNPLPPPQKPASSVAPAESSGHNIVAVVNGQPITRLELGQLCLVRWGEEVLESLVNKHLILGACQSQGIVISNEDIEEEIQRIAGKFGLSVDHWLKMLKEERDVAPQQYRRDIIWPTLALRKLAADKLEVTPDDLTREFEAEYGPKVQVRMISLTSRTKAEQVLRLVQANPADFPNLAKQYSDDPTTAAARGMIPPVRKHLGEPAIEQAVFALQPGEVSPLVEAANQFLIFRCEKHLPAAKISPQYRELTMQQLRDRIIERNLRDAAGELFQKLQAAAKVVNVLNDPQLRQQMPGVAATVNDAQVSMQQLSDECLARYGRDMLDTEINFRLLSQALQRKNLNVSQAALDEEVARAAEAYGFLRKDGTPDVNAWIKEVTEQEGIAAKEYIRDAVWPSVALKQLVGNEVPITPDDLQKGFDANYGERVEVLAIVLGNQRLAQEVWNMARQQPSREFFGQLAEQYSIESVSRANFGEIPPIRQHGGQPQIEKEAFRLQPDELSGIVAMGDKFIILKCLGRTRPVVDSLDEVRDELTKDIREKKLRLAMAEEFDRLKDAAQIDNFLAGTSQTGSSPIRPVSAPANLQRGDSAQQPAARRVTLAPRAVR